MKIQKKVEKLPTSKVTASTETTSYSEAQKHIKAAIELLGKEVLDKKDIKAREAITNLSVIMFELQ